MLSTWQLRAEPSLKGSCWHKAILLHNDFLLLHTHACMQSVGEGPKHNADCRVLNLRFKKQQSHTLETRAGLCGGNTVAEMCASQRETSVSYGVFSRGSNEAQYVHVKTINACHHGGLNKSSDFRFLPVMDWIYGSYFAVKFQLWIWSFYLLPGKTSIRITHLSFI